jgi:GDP-L-fucose synthase
MTTNYSQTIFLAGHRGMVGRAIFKQLKKLGYENVLTLPREDLDLMNQIAVNNFFKKHKIDQVYLAAAKVGGIYANNTYPADFIYENLMVECNVIEAAHQFGVQKLLFLGSSCIYPKLAFQPIKENALMTGSLEPTNEPYAIAKIAGIKLCESYNRQYNRDYRSVMPTNLYGPFDNFHLENSHVIPALIRRLHFAKINHLSEVAIWGSGEAMREFLYVDDAAAAIIHIMNLAEDKYKKNTEPMLSHINIGSSIDYKIAELAEIVSRVIDYRGKLIFDTSKPDGAPRKLMDISKIKNLGWQASTSLENGLKCTYDWFIENQSQFRT